MLRVEQQHAHLLLLEPGHLDAHQPVDVVGRRELRPDVGRRVRHPPADLDRRFQLGDLGPLQPAAAGQPLGRRGGETPQSAELAQDAAGQLGDHLAGQAGPQDDREQLRVRERGRAATQQALTRPLVGGQVLDGVGGPRIALLAEASFQVSPDRYEIAIDRQPAGPHYWPVSSTVTTTTVVVVTTAVSTQSAAVFSLLAILLLAICLMGREVVQLAKTGGIKRLGRGLDIATIPLGLAFVLIAGLSS